MDSQQRTPWQPHPSWANPLILALAVFSLLLLGLSQVSKRKSQSPPPMQVSLQARLQDTVAGFANRYGMPFNRSIPPMPSQPWDRALGAIELAESGDMASATRWANEGPEPKGPGGPHFRAAFRAAYQQGMEMPDTVARQHLRKALGSGYGALALERRLELASGRDGAELQQAMARVVTKGMLLLGTVGLVMVLGILGGIAFGIYLLATRHQPSSLPPPSSGMSGRALLIVLLSWFIVFALSSLPAQGLVLLWPAARPLAIPFQYVLHASFGLWFYAYAEGVSVSALLRRHFSKPILPALAKGLGFYGFAVLVVMTLTLLISPLIPKDSHPQQELLDALSGATGPLATVLMGLTLACLAPFFEEIFFRGALLSWLRQHLGARQRPGHAAALAVLISALAFGAIHLQPMALPTLSTLGAVLGLAALRTRSLTASVLVHALWNGGVFLLARFV